MPTAVRLGSDVLLCSNRIKGARVGLVCNHASIDRGFLHVIDRVNMCEGVTLAAIFGPQHGFRSDVQDNMVETPHRDDPRRRVPIYSLYSETREPTAEMLRGLDALVIDLQDIGARIYTYIYTMANCMRAAAGHAFAQHADSRHGDRLPGDSTLRGNDAVRRPRHHPPLRTGRRAVD